MPQQITVFGGTGYLGSAIVKKLLRSGTERIRIAVRHPDRAGKLLQTDKVEVIEANVTQPASVRRALDGSDGAVNAVSLYVQTREVEFEDIHVRGAANVAVAAREGDIALVHISGVGANSRSSQRYIRARGRGEDTVRANHSSAVLVRPTVLFSERGGLTEQILHVLQKSPVYPLFGRGETRLQPVHRDDVALAVTRLLERHDIDICECGGAEVKQYRAIVEQVADAAGQNARFVPVPFPVWQAVAVMAEALPGASLTRDQVALMRDDKIANEKLAGLADLGIGPQALGATLEARFGTGS